MSETNNEIVEALTAAGVNDEDLSDAAEGVAKLTETPKFTGSLRDLIRQRTETKARRTHKQWYCFDPELVTARREAEAEFVAAAASEITASARGQQQRPRKNGWSPKSQELAVRADELKAREREIGAMAVFHNLTINELEASFEAAREDGGTEFALGRAILLEAFMYWETADGIPIDLSELGRDDLGAYLDPEITDEGDWKPLADAILKESRNPIDFPTLLSS